MNALAKHTPGPWRVTRDERTDGGRKSADRWIIDSPTRKFMASLEVWELNQDPRWRAAHPEAVAEHAETMREVDANALLIAVAPEMAEALLALVDTANTHCPVDHPALPLARNILRKAGLLS